MNIFGLHLLLLYKAILAVIDKKKSALKKLISSIRFFIRGELRYIWCANLLVNIAREFTPTVSTGRSARMPHGMRISAHKGILK